MAGKITVTLEDVPGRSEELEEYVAALFQSARYFVEKKVIERDPTEVLELDAVATLYEGTHPSSVIVEAKSGGWGFPDIFKVLGWMTYLRIEQGAFFVSKLVDKDLDFVNGKCTPTGVRVIHLGEFKDARERFAAAGYPVIPDDRRASIWRLSYWAERNLIDHLRVQAKTTTKEGPRAALEYIHLVNNGVFFTPDIRDRLHELYGAYQQHPKLALGMAVEIAGGSYDPNAIDPTNKVIGEAMFEGRHLSLHAAFYAEHRARLAILKAAVDHEVAVEMGKIAAPDKNSTVSFSSPDVHYWTLPTTFREGLETLKTHKAFRQYPTFWQVFLWGFGGFYLADRTEQEFAWLAEHTGVPAEEVPNALRAYDILFPMGSKSWMSKPGPTQATLVKMMPMPLMGLGALHRKRLYDVETYYKLGFTDRTGDDLTRWHNSLVHLLADK